jgi:hypothetical protein
VLLLATHHPHNVHSLACRNQSLQATVSTEALPNKLESIFEYSKSVRFSINSFVGHYHFGELQKSLPKSIGLAVDFDSKVKRWSPVTPLIH